MTIFSFLLGNHSVKTESDISVLSDQKLPENKKGPAKPIAKRVYEMVEMRGVEPLSESTLTKTSPGADGDLHSLA